MSDLMLGAGVVVSALDSLGHSLVEKATALNLLGTALLVIAVIVDRAVSRRVRASWRIALYAPLALRVLIPLDWSVRLPHAPQLVASLAPLRILGGHSETVMPATNSLSLNAVFAIVYLAIAVLISAQVLVARIALFRALRHSAPLATSISQIDCPVVSHAELGPMAVGLLAPRIVIPQRLLEEGQEQALDCVLRHEQAHLRRGDAWLSLAMQVLAIAAWPIIPVWIAVARVRQLMELACDEAALRGSDSAERRRYGHTLLDMAERQSAGIALGAGELNFGSTLRTRIEALATSRHWPLGVQKIALSVTPLVLLLACGTSSPQPAAAPPKTTSASTGANGNDPKVDSDKDYGYEFEKDSAKNRPSSAALPPADSKGRIPPEVIQNAVRAHYQAFIACYEAGLKKDPKLEGGVTVRYTIADDGTTNDVADEHSTMTDKSVVACVMGEFQQITYSKGNGGIVTVVYPLTFSQ